MSCNPLCGYSLKKGVKIIAVADIVLLFFTTLLSIILIRYTSNSLVLPEKEVLIDLTHVNENDADSLEDMQLLTLRRGIFSTEASAEDLIIFSLAWGLLVAYILLEVWLCCTLLRAAKEGNLERCSKWFCWRLILMVFTVALTVSKDFSEHRLNYSDLCYLPLYLFRIFSLVVVYHFKIEIRKTLFLNVGTAERKVSVPTSFFIA